MAKKTKWLSPAEFRKGLQAGDPKMKKILRDFLREHSASVERTLTDPYWKKFIERSETEYKKDADWFGKTALYALDALDIESTYAILRKTIDESPWQVFEPWKRIKDKGKDREILKLFFEGLPYREIANAVFGSVGYVKKVIYELRKEYGEDWIPLKRNIKKVT